MKKTDIAKNYKQHNYQAYEKKYGACQEQLGKLAQASNRVSLLRAVAFALAGLLLFFGYQQKAPFLFVPALGSASAFLLLVRYHSRLEEEQRYLEDFQSVLKEYMARFGDGWQDFPADGARYRNGSFPEAKDLDLFGRGSLYQYICTAGTTQGQDQLALWLSLPGKDFLADSTLPASHEIKSRQQAVAELSKNTEFCMELEAYARRLRTITYEDSRKIMDNFFHAMGTARQFPAACRFLLKLFPSLTLASLLFSLLDIHRHLAIPLFCLLALAQLMAAFAGLYWNNKELSPVYQMNQTIAPYRKLFQILGKETFESPYLTALQETLLEHGGACAALKELEEISDSVCARHNIYAFLLYNSLFLHDYQCIERYGKWKRRYNGQLKPWLEALGKAEALISLSVICHTRQTHCLPEIVDSSHPVLSASDLRHPLLKETAAVGNDISLTYGTCMITGSNMSGKTTFLRSIGSNLILAYAGGFCTASDLQVSLMRLCTSIRTEDNVNEGISTFYAELLRIKQITEASREQIPMISLIDEIYKGTNSKDRIFAAKETIRNLSRPNALILATTHDLELCDLEHDPGIHAKNYHFAEQYKENRILFDYKLKDGRCTTTNARYLLRMAGILT